MGNVAGNVFVRGAVAIAVLDAFCAGMARRAGGCVLCDRGGDFVVVGARAGNSVAVRCGLERGTRIGSTRAVRGSATSYIYVAAVPAVRGGICGGAVAAACAFDRAICGGDGDSRIRGREFVARAFRRGVSEIPAIGASVHSAGAVGALGGSPENLQGGGSFYSGTKGLSAVFRTA